MTIGRFAAGGFVALVALSSANLSAQNAATSWRPSPAELLTWEAIRDEIELDEEQAKRLAPIFLKMEQEWSAALRRVTAKYQREVLTSVLEPQQAERLAQIAIQMRGTAVLADANFARRLGLSERQRSRIAKRFAAARDKFDEVSEADAPPDEQFAYLRRVKKALDESVLKVLTQEQQRRFDEIKGAPFGPEKVYAVKPPPEATPKQKR